VLRSTSGAPAGKIETFSEVPFQLGEARCAPDGLIHVTRGKKAWTALVEVKTGTNVLLAPQLEMYLDVAREQGFDALITISNETPAMAGQHPTKVDKRKLKKVALHHYPWSQVLFEAVMQKEHRGVADPDQAWILGELIRYLEHPRSGALEFDDMGTAWVPVREAVNAGTLRASDKTAVDVASRFDALLRYVSLRLGRQLGTDVTPTLTRRELADPDARIQAQASTLAAIGSLSGAIRIPHAVGSLNVVSDIRAGKITCYVDIDAPREGRAATRVKWLVRQLHAAQDTLSVEVFAAHARGAGNVELLRDVREDPTRLIADPKRDLRSFRVALTTPMGPKRGRGRGAYIDSMLHAVDGFYGDVLQHLKAWAAAPPRLRDPVEPTDVSPASLGSTAQSSQDGAEPAQTEIREPIVA
jgi:hypothetical protein